MNMHVGSECNVVFATCPQRYLESTFLRCDNVSFTTLPQPKHNVVTTLSQRDFVCWDGALSTFIKWLLVILDISRLFLSKVK